MVDDRNAAGFQRNMSFKTYKKMKLKMLEKDFCIKLTTEEQIHAMSLETEIQVDQFCLSVIERHWN